MKLKLFIYGLMGCLLTCGVSIQVLGQTGSADARTYLAKVHDAYRKATYLGFKVRYRYANAGNPGNTLDSLGGVVQMDKSRCRMLLDGTETVVNGKYIIQVMPDERLIYLGHASSISPTNPVQMLDSVFAHLDSVRCRVGTEAGSSVLTMNFPPGRQYSWVKMEADPVSGLFQRISYGLQVNGLVSEDLIDAPGHPGIYQQRGQLEMIFSDYEKGRFGDGVFDDANYITRIAPGHFEPVGQFRDYHIFLTNSNL